MKGLIRAIAVSVCTLMSSVAVAEILVLPSGGFGVTQSAATPQRGATQTTVLDQFGEPTARHQAVGTPAISSWDYPAFKVYFENGLVIHAVHRGV